MDDYLGERLYYIEKEIISRVAAGGSSVFEKDLKGVGLWIRAGLMGSGVTGSEVSGKTAFEEAGYTIWYILTYVFVTIQ